MSLSTETQRRFLQAVDPLVKKAISDPDFDPKELRQTELTDPQIEAIIEGTERNISLVNNFVRVMEGISKEDLPLVIKTADTLLLRGNVPIELVEMGVQEPERLIQILDSSEHLMGAIIDIVKSGLGPRFENALKEVNIK